MLQLPNEWRNDELLQFLLRHVVPIYFRLQKDGERHDVVFTAFLFSVYDRWLLMTAGHCITNMMVWRAYGYRIAACRLLDSFGTDARFKDHPVPFDYDESEPTPLGIHPTWDYGVLFISDNTRAQLEANSVVPFTEAFWQPLTDKIETYRLIGIPEVLIEAKTSDRFTFNPLSARVEKIDERPEGFEETNAPMFYGRLPTNPLPSLKGLSGGPILAFAHVDGELRYWLHAMQVSALGDYISGMLMQPLGRFLQEICEGKHDGARSSVETPEPIQ